jgi:nucleoside-diphosphate-sugar epimerase
VLHVASPFPTTVPKDENELIVPARDGALRVLRAARDAGVKRVVLTSSFVAIGYGAPKDRTAVFTEDDWTNLNDPSVQAYGKSKTIAERAAWDFIAREGGQLELAVVNPTLIFGPVLGSDVSASIVLVKRLLDGSLPGCPDLWFGVVDVRDVADLHLKAMTNPAARGERFLATSGDFVNVRQIAEMLKAGMGERARKVPTRSFPIGSCARSGRSTLRSGRFCPNSANARTARTKKPVACSAGRREPRKRRFSQRPEACQSLSS